MSIAHSHVHANTHLFLRLPTDSLKLIEIKPNTIIEVGKLGSFPSNLLLDRPYYYTYEILEKRDGEAYSRLRIVRPSELNAETITEDATPTESGDEPVPPAANGVPETYDLVGDDGTVIMKNNRLTVDDAKRQALSQQDIEELKKSSTGKEVIDKILANHSGLDEKTVFSKAKYTVRKTKKYLKRFTVLPMDIGNVIQYVLEKEPQRIMDMREETLGLMCAWGNAHFSEHHMPETSNSTTTPSGGRWLVADETGGLVVAALAERMGILYADQNNTDPNSAMKGSSLDTNDKTQGAPEHIEPPEMDISATSDRQPEPSTNQASHRDFTMPASTNTITLLHPSVQPNLSLLKYFGYDTNLPDTSHPLHTHLKPISWLQLLHPEEDPTYREPEAISDHQLQTFKSGKRGHYFKKRRRWERCRSIVDETRAGGFEGLVVASNMDAATIIPHAIPLIRGGGHVAIYSPTAEPLVKLMDLYSKERRTAYINHLTKGETPNQQDFPVDPRMLLAHNLQTSRVVEWQVLPGRTHPMMTSRGGPEGFLFTARKVVPLEGGVEARGNHFGKKRKTEGSALLQNSDVSRMHSTQS